MKQEKEQHLVDAVIQATGQPVDLTVAQQLGYGITAQYKRKNYDDLTARKKFHDSQFGDKKTTIGSDGELLHRDHKAAERKYGKEKASLHQAEGDHIDTIKDVYSRHKDNPFLKDEDIKAVVNRQKNLQELSKKENASKGGDSEIQRGIKDKNLKRVIKGVKAQAGTDLQLAGRTAKNAAVAVGTVTVAATGAAVEAGKETALITLTVSGLNNLAAVGSGQKDLESALRDVALDTADSFVSGAGVRMAQEVMAGIAEVAGAEQFANFMANDFPSAEIAMTVMTVATVKRYLDGEISGEDCAIQLIANAAGTLAYQLGGMIGGPAGAVIASVVATQITNTILEYRQEKKIQKDRAAEINSVLSQAVLEIAHQKEELAACVEADLKRWDDIISEGFDTILRSAAQQDTAGITQGLDAILSLFNAEVLYPTLEEFDRDFYDLDAPPLVL